MRSKNEKGLSVIVKRITRITVSLIFLFGVYIMLHGHLSPGGGFAGGVIIALSFIHIVLAFGKEFAFGLLNELRISILESIGALLFLSLASLGFIIGKEFFLNVLPKGKPFNLLSTGNILVSNLAIFIKVGMGLFAIFIALSLFRIEKKEKA